QAVEPLAIADKLAADKDHQIKAVLVQHNETSTGVYNPLKEISQARGAHPALLLVDAISGMGALPLETDDWDLDVVISGSQKAFMSPPGLSFISVSPRAWEVQENNIQPKYYFDLANAKKFMNKGQTPATPAVSLIYAVAEALQMMKEKGLDNIIDQHFFRRDVVRAGAEAIGIKPLADISCASGAVTALCVPEGITPSQLTKPMRSKYNTVVAGGMGKIKESTFRIGHLGYMNDLDLIAVLAALEMVLWEAGHKFQLGSGVAAAQRLMMERYK
ncbi:MAG: alanine--glyoxylate aminotransferase family protein, partial [Clostridiales bacterium]